MKTAKDIEYSIARAVYNGDIDQLLTSEVATKFNISSAKALKVLKSIMAGEVQSFPFEVESEGVRVKDGSLFVQGEGSGTAHHMWFLT